MMPLTARHVDLGDVGTYLLCRHFGGFVALATITILGQMRPVPEVVKAEGRPRTSRKGQRLIFLDVAGAAVAELLLSCLSRLSRLRRLVRVTGIAFGVMREACDDLRLVERMALAAIGHAAGHIGHLVFHLFGIAVLLVRESLQAKLRF